MLNDLELTGRSRTHIAQYYEPRFAAQPEAATAFLDMRSDALRAGIDLLPYSSFRDFRTQLRIWNSKFSGAKPLFDINGKARDFTRLSASEVIGCILNWSALPGGSRHHWGTEIDVVDGAVMPPGYQPKLLPEEVAHDGLFLPLHQWLDHHMTEYGFFGPYLRDSGGMYPEPWHLSYAPLSIKALDQVTVELLIDAVQNADILEKDLVLEKIPEIYRDHILNVSLPEASRPGN
ncbi:M15 family metallopeptidase [Pseudomonas sp. LS2P72]